MERIVDQVVNPKVASVFIPQVEDLVYNYLGIPRKKPAETAGTAETSNGKVVDLLPTDLEAVSPGSVKSNDDKGEAMDISVTKDDKMDIDNQPMEDDLIPFETIGKEKEESRLSGISELTIHDSDSASIDKSTIPLPAEEIKLENIPAPECSPPNIKNKKIDLEKIDLPKEPNLSTDIPLPDEMPKAEKEPFFNPTVNSDDDESSSDSSLRRNMSPLTPIRNFDNENSCDAQQGFDNDSDSKADEKTEPTTFRFTIEKSDVSNDALKVEKKETESISNQTEVYQFTNQINVNAFNTPLYDDSSNSHNLQIDYESDANSKTVTDVKLTEADQNSGDSNKKEKKDEKRSSHKSSHRSRDSSRHSSSKDKKFDSKHSNSRDSSRQSKDEKKLKDDKSKSSHKERSSDRTEKKDSRDSSKQRISSSHKTSNSKDKDSKHGTSRSSKHSSSSKHDDKKPSSSKEKEKEKSEKPSDKSSKDKKDLKDRDSKSSSHRSDKDKKGSSKNKDDRDKENKDRKEKKSADDHYSLSGRGNPNRRSTDRDSNDGSSSSKGSHNPSNNKPSENRNDNKGNSKSGNTSSSGDSTSPSDSVGVVEAKPISQNKAIRVDSHLEVPVSTPARLPFVPDVTLKKPKFAANLEEAKKMIKMRKFLEEEQKRMNQEAALLLEFQANVRPSLSQVYSSVPGPELEFACVSNTIQPTHTQVLILEDNALQNVNQDNIIGEIIENENMEGNAKVEIDERHDTIAETLLAMHQDGNTKMSEYHEVESKENVVKEEFVEQSKEAVIETLSNGEIKREDKVTIKVSESNCVINDEYQEIKVDLEAQEIRKSHEKSPKLECVKAIKVSENKEREINQIVQEELKYFADHEKFTAELERDKFNKFYLQFKAQLTNKMYLVNCDTYEENIVREVAKNFGQFEIVNYIKNGHLKLPKSGRNIIKNVHLANEITLPINTDEFQDRSPVFSPVRSECSFELSSDYDAKLEEMVIKTSRQEIMEIILGSAVEDLPTKLPKIDYCMDSNIESESSLQTTLSLKRKISEVESSVNNNMQVLTPNKQRKLSETDQISSTTEGEIYQIKFE